MGSLRSLGACGPSTRRGRLICGSFFSGIGLLDYGLHLAGFEHAWGCEADDWRRRLWQQRFRAPCYPDVRAFDAGWGRVDLVAGGFPCKGASTAGKREGFGHPETVLWREMARAIGDLRPRYVLVENVANILGLHDGAVWGEVLGDLGSLGYVGRWDCLPAAAVGAPHRRDRVFAVAAYADGAGRPAGWLTERPGQEWPWHVTHEVASVAPNASRDAEGGTGTPAGADGQRARAGDHAAADSGGERRQQVARGTHGDEASNEGRPAEHDHELAGSVEDVGRGVRVEWGDYEPAIRRWEAVAGAAPEPLVRGMDARGAARVERSRLSALGDGVQVQIGYLAGVYIRELEGARMKAAA